MPQPYVDGVTDTVTTIDDHAGPPERVARRLDGSRHGRGSRIRVSPSPVDHQRRPDPRSASMRRGAKTARNCRIDAARRICAEERLSPEPQHFSRPEAVARI